MKKTRRALTRTLLGIVILIAASVLVLAGIILYDGAFPAQRVTDLTNVTYSGPNGVTLHGYLARPTGDDPHPAVLMIHEIYLRFKAWMRCASAQWASALGARR